MEGSNDHDRFERREFVDDTQDSSESSGLKEEKGDVRVAKAGRTPRCQRVA